MKWKKKRSDEKEMTVVEFREERTEKNRQTGEERCGI